jgi:hypothetical protein
MPSGVSTSVLGASLPITGLTLSIGTSGSPDTLNIIANQEEYNQAMKSTVVMVTNVGDQFVRRQPTIVDPGEPTFKVFWVPEEPSHRNSPDAGAVTAGLRYLLIKRLLRQTEVSYPADLNGNTPADSFMAFTTSFGITGKVAGVFEAQVTMGISDQNPFFV